MLTRVRTWRRRGALDEQLALGTDPSSSPELAARARELTQRDALNRAASCLDAVVDRAEACGAAPRPPVPLRTAAVLEARAALLGLAQRLRDDDGVGARPAAMTNLLLTADDSPLYTDFGEDLLWEAARLASALIDEERQPSGPERQPAVRRRAVAVPVAR